MYISRFSKITSVIAGSLLLLLSGCGKGDSTKNKGADGVVVDTNASVASDTAEAAFSVEEGKIVSSTGRPVVVDFYADWCPPCRQMKPIFSQLGQKYGESIDFVSVNVDENSHLATQYDITSIPTFLFLAPDGRILNRVTGAISADEFTSILSTCYPQQAGE